MKKTITIVTPVFNNTSVLPDLFNAIENVRLKLLDRDINLEAVLVDDGSSDNSFEILAEHQKTHGYICAIKLTRNFGAIGAVKSILQHVRGDAFVFMASDLQDPPDLIPSMADHWLDGKKYVIARRRQREDTRTSNFFAEIFYYLLRSFVVKDYPKAGFDLTLMDRQFIPYLKNTGKHVNYPLFHYWLGFEPTFVDYDRKRMPGKKSSWTFIKKVNLAINSLLSFSRRPTRILFISGLMISLLSFSYAAFIIVNALLGRIEVPGFATTITLLATMQGITILFLGILSEYIWRIFDEVNGHPPAVIDDIRNYHAEGKSNYSKPSDEAIR